MNTNSERHKALEAVRDSLKSARGTANTDIEVMYLESAIEVLIDVLEAVVGDDD